MRSYTIVRDPCDLEQDYGLHEQPKFMTKWKYRVIEHRNFNPHGHDLQKTLNDLGEKGWEAVGVGTGGSSGAYFSTVVLKKQC